MTFLLAFALLGEEGQQRAQEGLTWAAVALSVALAVERMWSKHTESQERKAQYVNKIVASITDNAQKQLAFNAYMKMGRDELELIANTIVTPKPVDEIANYFGLTGGATGIVDNKALQEECLTANEIDWNEWAKNPVNDSSNTN